MLNIGSFGGFSMVIPNSIVLLAGVRHAFPHPLYLGDARKCPGYFFWEKRPRLVGPTIMHVDYGSPLDGKIYTGPT